IFVLEGKKDRLVRRMEKDRLAASEALNFEKARRIRDEIEAIKNLDLRGDADKDVQPEVFPIDPKKGLIGLRKVLGLSKTPRTIEGMDIAHLGGAATVAPLVSFLDALPRRPGAAESSKLSRHSAALRLLQYVRDEAHRFAQHYHHMLRRKRLTEE